MQIAVAEHISVPAEWAPQKAMWTAWPADPDEWNDDLATPRREVAALVRALSPSNRVRLLVAGDEAESTARAALGNAAEIVPARYGDIWLRDTGPIFARGERGPVALRFRTNGWGGKFDLPDDSTVGDDIAKLAGAPVRKFDFVLEGGAIEHDGDGTILTTRQTLLNDNRNGWSEAQAEAALREAFGAKKIIWIDRGLLNDHTDGHIDTLARFVGPGRVVCQSPAGADDPNAKVLERDRAHARGGDRRLGTQARGHPHPEPGPGGRRQRRDRARLARELRHRQRRRGHADLRHADGASERWKRCKRCFPTARSSACPRAGFSAPGIAGGGSFHCITREEPL